MVPSILLIEDEQNIADLLQLHLTQLGYTFEHAADGEQGLARALAGDFNLVILDINLPKINGLDICRTLRKHKERLPILMLTSRASDMDKVIGLELGADDYLTKPFNIHELIARVRARLRLHETPNAIAPFMQTRSETISLPGLLIDLIKREVHVNGTLASLTVREFDVLAFLASHPGRPFSRDELLETIWGVTATAYVDNVNSLMLRLRKKIEADYTEPKYLLTVWGLGYKFVDPRTLEPSNAAFAPRKSESEE